MSFYQNGGGPGDEFLLRLDADTGREVARIEAVSPPWETGGGGLASGFGSIWVTGSTRVSNEYQAVVQRIDPADNKVLATIPLGSRSGADIAMGPAAVWVSFNAFEAGERAGVARIDPATNEVVATIPLESEYVRTIVAVDGAVVVSEYVWEGGSGLCGILTSIDPVTDEVVASAPVGPAGEDCGIAKPFVWKGELWARSDGLYRVDPATAQLVGEPLAFDEHRSPRSFLLPDERGVWFAAYPGGNGNRSDTLAWMNTSTGEIEYFDGLEVGAIDAALGPDAIWTLGFDGEVTRIDLR